VLDEIAVTGFDGSELGPLGYYPEQPAWLRHELDTRELRLAGGFVMEPLHDRNELRRVLELTRRTCAALAGAGAAVLVVIDGLCRDRSATAGRSAAAARLPAPAWARLVATVEQIGALAADEFGLAAAFHPHAGTHVEFADEIERLLADSDPELVGLCLDTGHARYAGVDPLRLIERHGNRIRHVHLKDVDGAALARALSRGSSFEQAVADGVFCPLGAGDVDLAAVAAALERIGFDGWAVFEQDRAPGAPGARAEAEASLRHLRQVGIARAAGPRAGAR